MSEKPAIGPETDVEAPRSAGRGGWHRSRYNVSAPVPGGDTTAIANLFRGTCAEYHPLLLALLDGVEELPEDHPMVRRFARLGLIANFDERAALEAMGRMACAGPGGVSLVICPTMGCNFDCPYCFEGLKSQENTKMDPVVQDDVVALAGRMLDAFGARFMEVTWFGGEPLLAADVVESLSVRLIALAEERGSTYRAHIITNGYLLDRDTADMLARAKVARAQVTLDGVGAVHDATRYLRGGGPTFERIAANLRSRGIAFHVDVRQNVHVGNLSQMGKLESFIEKIARESGNNITYRATPVVANQAADARVSQVETIRGADLKGLNARRVARGFHPGRGNCCGAQSLWSVAIDNKGNLSKCMEMLDGPAERFGTAHDWDPSNPLETADRPDNLTMYLNTACPIPDEECRECVWLPLCIGGCPRRRLSGQRACTPFRDDPEGYVLALRARIGEGKAHGMGGMTV